MQVTTYTVNEQGLKEIKEFLTKNHKKGGDHFTRDMLLAWAADAEFQLSEGNPAAIEIKSSDSIHGHTQEYRISNAGLDAKVVEIDASPALDPRIGLLSSGRFYAFVHGYDKAETIGTLAEVQGALGLQPTTSQAQATAPEATASEPQCWQVVMRFASPAWDEVDGILLGPFFANGKADAIRQARKMADRDGHSCTGKGRYWFTAARNS